MFAKSPGDVIPGTRKEIGVKKVIRTIFVTNRKLLIAEYLPKGQKYNQDCFISNILPELEREKMRYKRGEQGGTFSIYMDHSKSHNGNTIQEKFNRNGLARCPYPPYALDLSPCDF
jgi:hypothetical protein